MILIVIMVFLDLKLAATAVCVFFFCEGTFEDKKTNESPPYLKYELGFPSFKYYSF